MKWAAVLIFVQYFAYNESSAHKSNPILTIPDGKLEGTTELTVGEKSTRCYTFRAIPYAKPPVGTLRFEPPVKNEKWKGILDATKEAPLCIQLSDPVKGQEDCLYLNVYTPNPSQNADLSVMVWFHGGHYIKGSTTYRDIGPDYLLNEGIIFVSVNYRLGIFGFLSTQDMVAPGNAGLKDQILALKWVQENINYFGGNPKKVTIAGKGAGGASVSYLLLSPLAKGLFRSAIMESSSSLCTWSFSRVGPRLAREVGQEIGVDTSSSKSLIQGLKTAKAQRLQDISYKLNLKIFYECVPDGLPIAPVLEPEHPGAFITKKMHQSFQSGNFHNVPMIIGFNSNETTSSLFSTLVKKFREVYIYNRTLLPPADLTPNPKKKYFIGGFIQEAFFKYKVPTYNFLNSDLFIRPIREHAIQCSKYVPVYLYQFSYEGILGLKNRTKEGVGDGEEFSYLFRTYPDYPIPDEDRLTRRRLVKLWTNFVKEGTPTPRKDTVLQDINWTPVKSSRTDLIYLDINKNLRFIKNVDKSSQEFYDDIYSLFGDPPYNTY